MVNMVCSKNDFKNKKIPLSAYISIINRRRSIYINDSIKETGINAGQVPILIILLEKKELCQNEISQYYKIDKSSIAKSIKKLEEKELVTRKINNSNRRKNIISLTEKGKEIAIKIRKKDEKWEELILKNLNIDHETFIEGIKEIAIASIKLIPNKEEKINERN